MMNSHIEEERETAISDLAGNVATYYSSLIENGVPEEFAQMLTVEFQACFLEIIQSNHGQNRDRD